MTRLEFRNRLCILRSIDRHELVEAGVLAADDVSMWNVFAADPYRWFLLRDDETAEKLWRLIERRALSTETNWLVAAEAAEAIAAGVVPNGCSIDAYGRLIVPDNQAEYPRGFSFLVAHFDVVLTRSGKLVKSRNGGVLKAARAL